MSTKLILRSMVYQHLDNNQTIEHIGRSARKALAGMCARYREFGGFLVVLILDYGTCLW